MLILEAQERIHAIGGSQREAEVKDSAKKTTESPNDGNKLGLAVPSSGLDLA